MLPFRPPAVLLGLLVATALSLRGMKRKSLSYSGAFSAWIVGFLSFSCGLRGFILIVFYLIGTSATKYRLDFKKTRDAAVSKDSVRGASQVLACSAIAVACSVAHACLCGEERRIDFDEDPLASALTTAIISHYACCCADTLASELGILTFQKPILITAPWKTVPPGTNGGVTAMGTFWSAVGGVLVGAGAIICDMLSGIQVRPLETITFGLICGILGSFFDSVLGAVLQASYYDHDKKLVYSGREEVPSSCVHISGLDILTNVQVNIVSTLATTFVGAHFLGPRLFS